jgi:hypothetical protein
VHPPFTLSRKRHGGDTYGEHTEGPAIPRRILLPSLTPTFAAEIGPPPDLSLDSNHDQSVAAPAACV